MSRKTNTAAASQVEAAATEINQSLSTTSVEVQSNEKAEEKDEAPKISKVISNKKKVAFLAPLIETGEFTAKELAEKAMKEFPTLTEVTIRTFLTDSKNVKYNKFDKLVVLGEGKKMKFAEEEVKKAS